MGCHGNHAFTHSRNKFFLEVKLFCIQWVPKNRLAPMKHCPDASLVKLDAGIYCIVFED